VPDVRTSLVSFTDPDGLQHSVEIPAGAFSKLRSSPMNAMKVPDWFKRSTVTNEIRVKQTEPFDQPGARPSPGLWR
jgi:hypothetical protein